MNLIYNARYSWESIVKKIKVIKEDNKIIEGARAVNFIVSRKFKPLYFITKFIEYSIIFYLIEAMIYNLFARYRSNISKLMRLDSCKFENK